MIAIVDAPSNLGLRPPAAGKEPGVSRLAEALRTTGFVERLGAVDGGRVEAPAYSFALDPAVGVRNWQGVGRFALDLADHLGPFVDAGQVPLVLGGDCSILLGPMLALRQRGRYGLVFLDGHHDLLLPETTQTGGAAGMDLALVTGFGPAALSDLRGLKPLVRPGDVVLLAYRSGGAPDAAMSDVLAHWLGAALTLDQVRERGPAAAVRAALDVVGSPEIEGFWIHLDADVLDNAAMPAVDSPQPDGLRYDELIAILRGLLDSGRVTGMTVTIFDPDLDPDGAIGQALAEALVQAFHVQAG